MQEISVATASVRVMLPTPAQAHRVRFARRWAAGRHPRIIGPALTATSRLHILGPSLADELAESHRYGHSLHGRHHAETAELVAPAPGSLAVRLALVVDDHPRDELPPPHAETAPAALVLSLTTAPAAPPATRPVVELARAL